MVEALWRQQQPAHAGSNQGTGGNRGRQSRTEIVVEIQGPGSTLRSERPYGYSYPRKIARRSNRKATSISSRVPEWFLILDRLAADRKVRRYTSRIWELARSVPPASAPLLSNQSIAAI